MTSYEPRVITKSDPTQVTVEWADGHTSVHSARGRSGPQRHSPPRPPRGDRLNSALRGPVAQLVEHLTENQGVASSILAWATT